MRNIANPHLNGHDIVPTHWAKLVDLLVVMSQPHVAVARHCDVSEILDGDRENGVPTCGLLRLNQ
ncbi:hypothetical protein DACRYDRAFT_24874 [Dacryopinax primogenitus]|uniref:Uncharacterized protein n=1 Tax=Dacryopinax primogenitus (strain DJM 731) TaxID=1858805 RepID=M5G2H1_DACPD|nr:uncharacterized protein DACRYDRAFT_24874 [Dacryopinax primogenitus]EJT97962.1 hypothetical protein DACRYDRAFT_24874 [Dacryopinax primogenitus]